MNEELFEIKTLTEISTNLSDGMLLLKPSNIAAPIKKYEEPIPEFLCEVPDYTDHFIGWQLLRKQPKEKLEMWSHPDAVTDVRLYLTRKVWAFKVEQGTVINKVAQVIAITNQLHKKYRADVHEALNHVVKHNEDVKALGSELRDSLDEVVKVRLEDTIKSIAGAALTELPELQTKLLALEQQK